MLVSDVAVGEAAGLAEVIPSVHTIQIFGLTTN